MKRIFCLLMFVGVFLSPGQLATAQWLQSDQIRYENLPKLTLPEGQVLKSLPSSRDNSRNDYFPTIFMQTGWSCNQASSVGYVFTYEMSFQRRVSAADPANQYQPLGVFNMLNRGLDNTGVSYFDSWDLIRANGVPNVLDFGQDYFTITKWMTGYDKYYNAMKNRVGEVYAIDVGSPEGLLTLKHWIYDHMDGSPAGGLANFQIGSGRMQIPLIPDGLEEEGQHIVIRFDPDVGHAMTFVGWNDAVKYDVNYDGQYTNDVDINGDGIVDMRDWEIGAMLVVNSWGQGWGDAGKVWVMYRLLAESVENGGIWNNAAMVVKPQAQHEPDLTIKLGMRYTKRNRLKIQAGVALDVNATAPEKIIDFPCFNYQGGDLPMQGIEVLNGDFIEIGLDITPLMEFIPDDQPARIFLEIIDRGMESPGEGRIESFSVIDYKAGGSETIYPTLPMGIKTRDVTRVSVVMNPAGTRPRILTESLPEAQSGSPYLAVIQASGGTAPYTWTDPSMLFTEADLSGDFNFEGGTKVLPDGVYTAHFIGLPFSFPFYGKEYQMVTILENGGIIMGNKQVEYPYVIDPRLAVYQNNGIFPFYGELHYIFSTDRVSYEIVDQSLIVRWRGVLTETGGFPVEFAVVLNDQGKIQFHYNYVNTTPDHFWIAALSAGDMINYHLSAYNTTGMKQYSALEFKPVEWPAGLTLTESGVLYGQVNESGEWTLPFKITDHNGRSHQKELLFKTKTSGVDGIPEEELGVRIYPNPASDMVSIHFVDPHVDCSMLIVDCFGKEVKKVEAHAGSSSVEISVADLPSGVYFVKRGNEIAKFVKR